MYCRVDRQRRAGDGAGSSAARNSTARAISSAPRAATGISGRMLLSSTSFAPLHHLGVDIARADHVHGDAALHSQRQRLVKPMSPAFAAE